MSGNLSLFSFVLFLPPFALIAAALGSRRVWWIKQHDTVVVICLTIGLGVWAGLMGASTYGLFWYCGFLLNPLIVGIFCSRHPIIFGCFAGFMVAVSGIGFFCWFSAHSQNDWGGLLKDWGGVSYFYWLPWIGMALSLIPTVPITLYRRYFPVLPAE